MRRGLGCTLPGFGERCGGWSAAAGKGWQAAVGCAAVACSTPVLLATVKGDEGAPIGHVLRHDTLAAALQGVTSDAHVVAMADCHV